MMDAMTWSEAQLRAEIASPEWGAKVLEALRRHFTEGRWLLAAAALVDSGLEFESDGTSVLLAVYDHPSYERRIGLRHRLDHFPLSIPEGRTPAEGMAEDIAVYQISEPLGRYAEILVEDGQGVWWWGDGFPHLTESPDAPWYAGLPRGRWRSLAGTWTVAARDEQVCGSVAVSDEQELDRRRPVVPPPQPVCCIRPEGHVGIHVSASRAREQDGPDREVFGWD
jgi:hypothetical protein